MGKFKFIRYEAITTLFNNLIAAASSAATAAANTAIANYFVVNSAVSTAYTIDMSVRDNQLHILTLTGNVPTLNITNIATGKVVVIKEIQGGAGGFGITFPASCQFPGGAAIDRNTVSGKYNLYTLIATSATTIDVTYAKF